MWLNLYGCQAVRRKFKKRAKMHFFSFFLLLHPHVNQSTWVKILMITLISIPKQHLRRHLRRDIQHSICYTFHLIPAEYWLKFLKMEENRKFWLNFIRALLPMCKHSRAHIVPLWVWIVSVGILILLHLSEVLQFSQNLCMSVS